jgi:hypothetical protein
MYFLHVVATRLNSDYLRLESTTTLTPVNQPKQPKQLHLIQVQLHKEKEKQNDHTHYHIRESAVNHTTHGWKD